MIFAFILFKNYFLNRRKKSKEKLKFDYLITNFFADSVFAIPPSEVQRN